MSGGQERPDFAKMRAVEILANLHDRIYTKANVPPPPLDKPVILFNETCAFQIGKTTQETGVSILGWGLSYPTRAWHTYAVAGEDGARQLLSGFYKDHGLIAAELYVPKTDRTPNLEPRRQVRSASFPVRFASASP